MTVEASARRFEGNGRRFEGRVIHFEGNGPRFEARAIPFEEDGVCLEGCAVRQHDHTLTSRSNGLVTAMAGLFMTCT